MTNEFTVNSWEECLAKISDLQKRKNDKGVYPRLLFRGQQDSKWQLETTLERAGKTSMDFIEYYRIISYLQPEIETLTQNQWQIPEYEDAIKLAKDYDSFSLAMTFGRTPAYGYMAHLRHHGFPSPLLDWTRSPHIAAYFAFNRHVGSDTVAIYVLFEATMQSGSSRSPRIVNLGSYVKTHRRHFLQQSEYTMCLIYGDEWQFMSHEGAFDDWGEGGHPCNFTIYKINVPTSERLKVLRDLDAINLNAFSLFGSEESLMETLALRELRFTSEN
ncbi:MAG TPA: FRG domain-containing protein [Rhizomicrobium sp.]|nr:FRG domain-containing protein [Rhizomicrobium sp.]